MSIVAGARRVKFTAGAAASGNPAERGTPIVRPVLH